MRFFLIGVLVLALAGCEPRRSSVDSRYVRAAGMSGGLAFPLGQGMTARKALEKARKACAARDQKVVPRGISSMPGGDRVAMFSCR